MPARPLTRAAAFGCGSAITAATILLTGFHREDREVVRAERVELLAPDGKRHAMLSADTTGIAITVLGKDGQPSGILRFTMEPRLALQTGQGRELAGLGWPKVQHLTE